MSSLEISPLDACYCLFKNRRPEFVPIVKPRLGVGKTKRGKGTKIMAVADRRGLPIAVCTESATPHEVTLVQQTLAETFVEEPVERVIGDNAYDSDQRDRELAETGVEMSALHRLSRKNVTQDGRSLRRYQLNPVSRRATLLLYSPPRW
jgi:hypothetical protein